jgi:hypothetical protein
MTATRQGVVAILAPATFVAAKVDIAVAGDVKSSDQQRTKNRAPTAIVLDSIIEFLS